VFSFRSHEIYEWCKQPINQRESNKGRAQLTPTMELCFQACAKMVPVPRALRNLPSMVAVTFMSKASSCRSISKRQPSFTVLPNYFNHLNFLIG